MKLGIMQPYFMPYIGYFELMCRADTWIVFDTAQYIRHGWVNRNRIHHPAQSWQYIAVPLKKHHRETPIKDILVNNETDWRRKIIAQLMHYRGKAPYYEQTLDLVRRALDGEEDRLTRINVQALKVVCEALGFMPDISIFSEIDLELGPIHGPGDWALRISEALDADEYINPPGGKDLFDPAAFDRAGVKLAIQEPVSFSYDCAPYEYIPGLSIVDVLMWNAPETVGEFLRKNVTRNDS